MVDLLQVHFDLIELPFEFQFLDFCAPKKVFEAIKNKLTFQKHLCCGLDNGL